MPQRTGIHDISQLQAVRFQSVVEYGLDAIQAVLEADLEVHNRIMVEMVGDLCEITTDRQRAYGVSDDSEMTEVDEYMRAPAQRSRGGNTVGFPLRAFQYNLGWTQKYFELKTPADVAETMLRTQKAHRREVRRQIQRALFSPTNYVYNDHLVDKVDLNIKALINADGMGMPDGPNAELFDGATHTHYDAVASLTNQAVLDHINDVVEHGHGSGVRTYINRSNESAWRGLADFEPYQDPRMVFRTETTPGQTLDITRVDDRAIGVIGASEVWVKPWVPATYAFTWASGDNRKPLAFRQRAQTSLQGLRIVATIRDFPLIAEFMEVEFGVSVYNRTNGAVLFFNGGSYTAPSF